MNFIDDLEQPLPEADGAKMREELHSLAIFRSLRFCRIFFCLALSVLTILTAMDGYHIWVPLYALLGYFLFYLAVGEWCKKRKTQGFLLQTLRKKYDFSYAGLLNGQLGFAFSFVLLFALQYAYLRNMILSVPALTYAPAILAVLMLALRYLTEPVFLMMLKKEAGGR